MGWDESSVASQLVRIRQLEEWKTRVENYGDPILLAQQMKAIEGRMARIEKLLWTVLVTLIGAAVTFGFTVIVVSNNH